MATQSILPYTFKLLENNSSEFIQGTIDGYQQPDERFIVEYYDKNQLDGVYIFVLYYKESVFNYETNGFKLIDTSKSIAIQFHINLLLGTLDIWSGKKYAQKLITALTMMFENKIIMEPYEISFEKSMKFLKMLPNITIGIVKVEDVSFDKDIIASCTFNLTTHSEPFTVLDKYIQRISKITITINSTAFENNDDTVSLSIYQSGAIVIYKSRNQLSTLTLEKIQKLLEESRRM